MRTTLLTLTTALSLAAASPQGPPPWITGAPSGFPFANGAFPTGIPSDWASSIGPSYASEYSSWFSAHSSDWASLTAAYGTDWSKWSSAIATMTYDAPPWATGTSPGGPPFFAGGPGGHGKGWHGPPFAGGNGYGPFRGDGPWTSGPWTKWWNANGTAACPPATWTGWTAGPWGTNAPWTSWSGCAATTTASSVYTTTLAGGVTTTATSFGVQLAEATGTAALTPTTPTGAAEKVSVALGGMLAAGMAVVAVL